MDWTQFAIFILGNMVFTLTLWLWNRSESRTDSRRVLDLIEAINKEIKDFHGRLEKQDAQFKGALATQNAEFNGKWLLLEERYRGK